MSWLAAGLVLLALPVLAACGYLGCLAVVPRRGEAPVTGRVARFAMVVPAHDEEAGIATTVRSLLEVDYPRDRLRVVVVADNCTDQTAEKAREAGAEVIERSDDAHRGKGYALAMAFERLAADAWADAYVVVDADSSVSPNLLEVMAARVESGAEALQTRYGVRNPDASWRTRLMALAFALFHDVRAGARERLGLSCGLWGNGMALGSELVRRVPYSAFSIVEDVEYGLMLGLSGTRVQYVGECSVLGEMPSSETASRSQRLRWEGGRLDLVKQYAPTLLARGFKERSPLLLDLGIDLLIPPLSLLVLAVGLGLGVSMGGVAYGFGTAIAAALWSAAAVGLLLYVWRGLVEARLGWRGITVLLSGLPYATWKLVLWARSRGRRREEWIRTARESNGGPEEAP